VFFCLFLSVGTVNIHQPSKIKLFKSHNTVEINLIIFWLVDGWIWRARSIQIIKGYGSGSLESLRVRIRSTSLHGMGEKEFCVISLSLFFLKLYISVPVGLECSPLSRFLYSLSWQRSCRPLVLRVRFVPNPLSPHGSRRLSF
jgi:hypothetical protein